MGVRWAPLTPQRTRHAYDFLSIVSIAGFQPSMTPLAAVKSAQPALEAPSEDTAVGHRAVVARARDIVERQAQAIHALAERIDESFARALRLLLHTPGHVVVSGLGKSGLIGAKLAATFASTGTPSFFVHTTEALHGDLGKITPEDTVILLSHSGETTEVLELMSHLTQRAIPTIAIVGERGSSLARAVDVVLDASVEREACPNNLAPTNSTLVALALGDTLAVCLMQERVFGADDFARLHPAGQLGRRLRMKVKQVMRSDALPVVSSTAPLVLCLSSASQGRLGVCIVVDEGGRPLGILGRHELALPLSADGVAQWFALPAGQLMRRTFLAVAGSAKLSEIHSALEQDEDGLALVLDPDGLLGGVVER